MPPADIGLTYKIGHLNQVLPSVRYWIPHIRVISPEGLQGELEKGLRGYPLWNLLSQIRTAIESEQDTINSTN